MITMVSLEDLMQIVDEARSNLPHQKPEVWHQLNLPLQGIEKKKKAKKE